jgi:predicted nucleotidyltransferase
MWRRVYEKRRPETPYEIFVLHEERTWIRGQIDGTYFDLLFTRAYDDLDRITIDRGTVLGRRTIEARVTDDSLAFDSPAVYEVEHDEFDRVISFTHTYSGQALAGETIEACGVAERHGNGQWLVVGTTREARGEYIISKTLVEER